MELRPERGRARSLPPTEKSWTREGMGEGWGVGSSSALTVLPSSKGRENRDSTVQPRVRASRRETSVEGTDFPVSIET